MMDNIFYIYFNIYIHISIHDSIWLGRNYEMMKIQAV